ncbi:MAG: RNA-binding S4 domain-containing protein [Saprospiraceae bacterium]|nr:RNA-binding S4 domain-containing protein [Saprospiraceae bacterium]
MPEKIRLDKWLWAVRIYKSRTLATEACKKGRIRCKQQELKPAHLIKTGDLIEVRKNGFNFLYLVVQLIEKRVSAALAVNCFENKTPAEELNKYESWFLHSGGKQAIRTKGSGRPTKRERREIDALGGTTGDRITEEE